MSLGVQAEIIARDGTINSTDSDYTAPEKIIYNVVDDNSSAYDNQKNIDYIEKQSKEYSVGDKMPNVPEKDLNPATYIASGAGNRILK